MKPIISFAAALACAGLLLGLGCGSKAQNTTDQPSGGGQPAGSVKSPASTSGSAAGGTSAPGTPAPGSPVSGDLRTDTAAGISYQVPASWKSSAPSSSMRAAQYSLPVARTGDEAPELVVYFFGAGSGGSAQANIQRWIGQMSEPDGKSAADQAKQDTQQIDPFKVTTVRLDGTYSSSMMPGMSAGAPKPDYRLWGAVVEGNGGPWFFKAVGPSADLQAAEPALDGLLASLKPAK